MKYAETVRLFSQKSVSAHIISWHGIILLCGPPGSGKTSLCKALAQKISIRWLSGGQGFSFPFSINKSNHYTNRNRKSREINKNTTFESQPFTKSSSKEYLRGFSSCKLVEIKCGSLFTKWFGESAKAVSTLMTHIHDMVISDNNSNFVCVLIDEVESLTMSRSGALNSNEPSDYLRVVNTILTHLDMLVSKPVM